MNCRAALLKKKRTKENKRKQKKGEEKKGEEKKLEGKRREEKRRKEKKINKREDKQRKAKRMIIKSLGESGVGVRVRDRDGGRDRNTEETRDTIEEGRLKEE